MSLPFLNTFSKASATWSPATSFLFLMIKFPMCLLKTTASSNAEQPPCPRSGVIGCIASTATVTFPLLKFPSITSHGNLNNRGAQVIVERSKYWTTLKYDVGKFLAKLLITSLFIASGSWGMSSHRMITLQKNASYSRVYKKRGNSWSIAAFLRNLTKASSYSCIF